MRTSRPALGEGAFGPEPAHDPELGRLLAEEAGAVPMSAVDWSALASRISARVTRQVPAPWWSYAASWERRMLPLVLAAGLAGAFALWSSSVSSANAAQLSPAPDVATVVASGTSAADAASHFVHSLTSALDPAGGVNE